jgi:cell division protein FtsW (lipid II flippase)
MVLVAGRFRDDGPLRHYKYTWALAGTLLLVITFLFGREVNGARLWIFLGPIGFQPGEAIKIVLVIFIAAYLAEKRTLLAGASARIGPIKVPPLPYLLPMIAIFVIVMLVVVISRDLGTALLFMGIFLTMLFVATGRRSYVLLGILLFIAGSFVAYNLFGPVRVVGRQPDRPVVDPVVGATRRSRRCTPWAAAASGRGSGRLPTISGHHPALPTDSSSPRSPRAGPIGAFPCWRHDVPGLPRPAHGHPGRRLQLDAGRGLTVSLA